MKKQTLLAIAALAVNLALAVISYLVLPDRVVMQLTIGGVPGNTLPKLLAVAVPFLLCTGGGVFLLHAKGDRQACIKSLFVSAVGLAAYVFMLAVNLG